MKLRQNQWEQAEYQPTREQLHSLADQKMAPSGHDHNTGMK